MGGGGGFEYPKGVWSPSGGFWADPKGWRKNTALYIAGMLILAYPVFRYSAGIEQHTAPKDGRWVPSMMWCKNFAKPYEAPAKPE